MAQRQSAGDYFAAIKRNAPVVLSGIKEMAGAQLKPSLKHLGIGAGMMGGVGVFGMAVFRFFALSVAFLLSFAFNKGAHLSLLLSLFLGFLVAAFGVALFGLALFILGKRQFAQISGPTDAMAELSSTMDEVSQAATAGADIAKAGPPRHAGDEAAQAHRPAAHYVVDPIWAAKQRAAQRAADKAAKAAATD
ncbi:MAG: phage holin family protein [Propionibacteriaceae bacterium]|nr:phage holin family protein [Propionibacteriaceae bacterium]